MKKTRYITLTGLLLAIAIVLSAVENTVFPPLPLGIKPGLSNIVIMFSLFCLDWKSILTIAILKSGFVFLTRSVTAGFMSMSGGILSAVIMILLMKKSKPSLMLISVFGAIAHNIAQLFCSALITQSTYTLWYFPVLILTGLAAGILTGLVLKALMPALYKTQKLYFERIEYTDEANRN